MNRITSILLASAALLAFGVPLLPAQIDPRPATTPATRESAWVTPEAAARNVKRRVYDSKAAATRVSFHVYTPPGYDAQPDRRYPVIYWLHGSGGSLPGIAPVSGWFDAAITAGKIPPALIVFPNGLTNGMWVDSKDGRTPIETVLLREVMPMVDHEYRTIAKKDGRIIEGFSMGGYGAGRIAMKHPELFAAVSMLGAGPLQDDFRVPPPAGSAVSPRERRRIFADVFGNDAAYFTAQHPATLAKQNADNIRGQIRLRIAIGSDDFTLPANRQFTATLSELKIDHDFTCPNNVGHDTLQLLRALGEKNWDFYRTTLGPATRAASRPRFDGD